MIIMLSSAALAAAQPAALPASASPMPRHEMHGQADQHPSGLHKDCCHDCCKDMAREDEGHEADHSGHSGQ